MPVTLELRLLLLALALRGEAVSPSVSPSVSPAASAPESGSESCGAALADVLRRLRELEGHVQALRGHCGDKGGPQAGTGRSVQLCAPPAGGGCACPAPSGEAPPPAPPPACPRGCSDQGRCERGRCRCFPGWSGPDCATPACSPGWGGARCDIEVPWVTPRLASRTPTSLRITWPQPLVPPDGYRVTLVPLDDPVAMTTHELPSSAVAFSVTGLSPGRPFELLVQARRGPHLGAPGVLRLRTALIPSVPHYDGSPGSPQGSLGSPAVAPSARGPPESPGSPGSPVSPISPDLSLGSPGSLGSPAPPKVPAPPAARGSLGSPAPARSSVSPESPESPASPEFPGSSVSPDFSVPPESPESPELPGSPESPVFPGSPPPPWSPVSPWPSLSPGIPSLQDLVARLSTYSGSLLQRLESHLRATNFPLRGNQTVPGVARAILAYILRRHPSLGRAQGATGEGGNQEPVLEWGDVDGMKLMEPWKNVGKTVKAEPEEQRPSRPVLGDLSVTSITPSSMQLQWSVPEGSFDSFTLQYRDAQGQPQALPIDGGSRSVTVPGLSPSHRYRFHLYGLRDEKRINRVSIDVITAAEEPEEQFLPSEEPHEKSQPETTASNASPARAVLGELRASSVTPSSVQLHWTVPEGSFDSFTLQYRDPQGQPQALPIDGGSRSVTVPGLSPSHRYRFHLYGLRGRKKVDHVSTEAVTAAAEPEELPLPSEKPQHKKPRTEPPATEAPLVRAVLGELRASSVTPSSVQLHWTVPKGSFDSFTLQYRDPQGQPQALPIDGGSRSVTVPGLSPSHRYRFHLYGLRGRKKIDHVSTEAVTGTEEPEEMLLPSEEQKHEKLQTEMPPSEGPMVQAVLGELRASSVTPDSVQLHWTVPEGSFDSFTLQYWDPQGQPQALPIDGGSRSVTVPGLSPSHRYRFHLYGLRGRKKTDRVSIDIITAAPDEPEELPLPTEEPQHEKPQTEAPTSEATPAQPVLEDLRVSSITPDSVQLHWTVPKGSFDSFTLQYRDPQGQPQALPIDGGSRSVTVPGLSPSHRYRFHLYGLRGRKKIDHVSTEFMTGAPDEPEELPLPTEEPQHEKPQTEAPTSEATPAQPVLEDLRVSSITPDSVQLHWTVPKGSFDSFTLQYRDPQGQPQALPIDGGSRSVTVPGLSPSHRYRFHLYGLRGRKKIDHVSTEFMTGAAEEPEELPLPTEEPQHEKPQTEAPTSEATPAQAVLEDLRVSSITPSSVQLHWTVPKGSFDSFTLQYRDPQGQPQALPIDGGSRSVTVPGLSPSHRYRFHLYGLRGGKRIDRVSIDTVTATEEPLPSEEPQQEGPKTESPASEALPARAVLGELRASSVTPDSVQLHWTVAEGSFDSFMLQYRDAQGQPQALPIDGRSRSVTVPGLSPSQWYRFHLCGLQGRKKIDRVSTDVMTASKELLPSEEPQQEKPKTETPTSEALPARAEMGELKASSVTPDSVQLHWTVPEGSFDSFTLQYRDPQGQPQALPIDGRSRSVTVPGLSPSHQYRFHLYGLRGRKKIDHVSTEVVTASDEPLPSEEPEQEAPKTESPASEALPARAVLGELRASSVTPDSVQLHWTVPEGSFDSFMLQYRDAQGQPQALPIDGGSRSVTVPGLSPSHRYRFHLYGLRGRKKTDHVSTEVMTGAAEEPEELPLPTEEPQHEKPQTEAPTSEATPAQPVLEDLRVSSVSPGSVQLHWTVPKGSFDSFTLQYRDPQGQPQALPIDGGSRSVTVPGLSPSHRYRFHIYGLRGGKRIDRVSIDTVTATEEPLPSEEPQQEGPKTESPASEALPARAVLGELRASSVTPDSVQLHWTVAEGSFDSFMLQYRDAQGQPQALPIDGRSRSVTVPGLSPSQWYRFHLCGLQGRKKIDRVSTDVMTASKELLPSEEPQQEKPKTETPTSEALPARAEMGELKASSVTPDSVQLHWTVPEGSFDSFTLQYRDPQGQPQALPIDGRSRSVTVPGLSPSHQYRFHLYGLRGRKKIDHVSTEVVTASDEPLPSEEPEQEAPKTESPASEALPARAVLGELRASSVTPDSVQLHWTVPEGSFDSFMLQYRDAQGQPQALPIDGGSRSVTVPGLSPSHRYRFHLYGLRGRKKTDHVSTEVMTGAAEEPEELPLPTEEPQHEKPQTEAPTSEATPAQPVLEDLRVSSVSPGSVQLHWTVPKGSFDSFTLQYRDPQGQPQALPIDGGSRSVTVPGLSPSHRYRFHIYGLRGGKRIDRVSIDTVTATEEPLPSEEPQQEKPKTESPASEALPARAVLGELKVSSVTPDSVQLHWTVPEGSFDSFTLQYRDPQGQPQALPIDVGSRSVTVPGLSPSHRYRFHLYGLRGRKKIDHVSTESVTGAAEEPEELPLPTEEPQHEKPQTEAPTSEATPAQAVLEDLRVSSITPSSVQLHWTVPKGSFDSFMLQYRDPQGQPQALPIDGGSRSVTVPGLSPSHRYRFHLYGLRGGKRIDRVSIDTVTATEEPLPSEEPQQEAPKTESPASDALPARAVLGELMVSSVTPSSVQLHWTVPKGSFDSFTLQYRDAQGQPQALPIDGGSRSVTVPGLSPSHRYRFHLYGLKGRKKTDHVSTEVVTGAAEEPEELPLPTEEPQHEKPQTEAPTSEATPAQPVLEDLRVSSITPSSVQLHWTVPKGSFDSFTLQYRDPQGQPQALPIDGGSRSVTVPGLSPSHRYRFHLYGLRGGKRIDRVSIDTVTEDPKDLSPPSMDPTNEGSRTEAPTAQHHKPEHSQTEAPLAQAVLGELKVSGVTPDSVGLQWSISEGSFDSFTLQYRDPQGQPQALPIDGGSRSVTVPGLSPSHRYRFHLYGMHRGKRIDHVSIDVSTAATDKPEEPPSPSEEPQTEALPTEDNQPEQPQAKAPPGRAVLEELRASSVTPSSVQLHWTVPEGSFDSFTLQYRDAQGQPQALPIDGGSRSVTVPGLSPSHRYRFHLYGLRGRKKIDHVSTEVMTATEEPLPSVEPQQEAPKTEAPTSEALPARAVLGELRVSSVTPDSVQLHWTVAEGSFDSFTLQYRDPQGQPQALPIDGGSRSVTVPGLSPSHRYRFHLYGLRGRKRTDRVSTDIVTAAAKTEELPLTSEEPETEAISSDALPARAVLGELKVSSVTPDSVQLHWTVPEGSFDSFTLQYRDAQGQPQALPIDGGSRSVTVPGLSPSHRYRFHLYGLQGGKRIDHVSTDVMTDAAEPEQLPLPSQEPQSEQSQTEQPQTEQPQTEASQGQVVLGKLRVSSVTPSSVQLHWTVPAGSFDSFTLQYRDAQGQPQALAVDGGSRSVTVPGLSPSHRYRFHLYGLQDRRRIDRVSTDVVTADPEDLSLPSMDTPTGDPPDEDHEIAHPQAEAPTSEASSRAVLGELRASSVTPSSVQLHWTVPEGSFDSFTLQYRDAQGQPQALPIDGGSRSVTVPGLSPSHRYRFHLYGLRGRKKTDHVSTDVITADGEAVPEELPLPSEEPQDEQRQTKAPSATTPARAVVGELKVSSVTPSSVQLHWTVPEGSFDSFTLQYRDSQGQPQALPIDGGSRSVTVPGLSPSHRYRFHLYGLRGGKRVYHTSTEAVTAAANLDELPMPSEELQPEDPQPRDPPVGSPSTETRPARAVLGELRASSVTPSSVQLHWTVPEGSFDSFMLQYRDPQGQPQALPIDGGSRSVTVPGLSPSHRYRFHLYGLRGGKRIDRVSIDVITATDKTEELPLPSEEPQPEDPRGKAPPTETTPSAAPLARAVLGELRASSVTPSSVQLHWTVPEGSFDSFTLQYRDPQGQPQALPIDGGSRSVTVPGLSPSHRYRFHLYGLRGGKRIDRASTDVITATAKTEELPLPSEEPQPEDPRGKAPPPETTPSAAPLARAVLGELRASSVTPDSVQLHWTVPEGSFDSFTLQYRDPQGQPQALPIDGGSRSVTVPGLSPSHRYRFHLYGLRGGKRTDHISTEATTGTPGTLWVGSVWPRSAWLHWDPLHTPPDGYELEYGPPGGPQQSLWLPPEATSRQLWGLEPAGRYGVRLRGRGGRPQTAPLEATFDTPPLPHPHPRDCAEEQLNGPGPSRETLIFLGGDPARPLRVFCDMETDGGGWLVFQRRQDGSTDFWRGWESYARGFGNVSGEFWLGNEALHELTAATPTELRVDLRTARDSAFAVYRDFSVGRAEERYRLRVGAFSGTAGDALSYHSGSPFSTRDRDFRDPRDRRDPSGRPRPPPCAVAYGGAWWYRNCHYANLNGRYGMPRDHQGIHWFPWKGFNVSIPFTEMKLRPQRG